MYWRGDRFRFGCEASMVSSGTHSVRPRMLSEKPQVGPFASPIIQSIRLVSR